MKLSRNCRQNLFLLTCFVAASYGAHLLYQTVQAKWVIYHEAEKAYVSRNWTLAVHQYEQSFKMGLNYPVGMLHAAHAYSEMKNYAKAKEWYERYLKVKPSDYWALKAYAGTLTANGEFEKAAEIQKRLLERAAEPPPPLQQ